tara:strand:- start:1034 stop:1966 length:933 start_codon:yes stop_codon:yes gene_type:complete
MKLRKPKFWDYKKPNFFSYLFYPISLLIKIYSFIKTTPESRILKIKTICVGNIYVGGTGKTSLSIKINKILREKNIKSCFIKKFYKDQIDEQKILENNGKLFLASKRIDAIRKAENENYEIAILDDGLQDKTINSDITIVCFNNINWIGNGMTIPSGPLRENINKLKKYDHACLNGNLENVDPIKNEILKINPDINIHVAKYEPVNLNEFKKEEKYLVFSGIGNHKTFISMIKSNGLNIIKEIEFPDHYEYSENDINIILKQAAELKCKIITTEKDYIRLNNKHYDEIKFIKSELNLVDEDKLIKNIINL